MEKLPGRLVATLVGMGAEEIALGLKQVGGKTFAAIAVVIGEARSKGRNSNPVLHGCHHGMTPVGLRLRDDVGEKGIEKEIL